ncbi:H-NS family nucleoid-associated regulatory protein [Massilia sp. TS11]|uniref:H-NS histone family protein n=1 Tax=Massilia sp. TS11 TaxID=2908003 RepID=UPI001EDBADC3|nr:H-NS histone family protein [Massilia sp. TS11]MCG2583474.1 H-NS histone family protein [Massilia sp. TS11]
MNLQQLSLNELRAMQEAVGAEMQRRERQEKEKAREQILAIANSVGLPLKELIEQGKKLKAGGPIRYRHPENAEQQWTGRGRQPRWVKDWIAHGRPMEALRV